MFDWHTLDQLMNDALYVRATREALKIEREAWDRCNEHRNTLQRHALTQEECDLLLKVCNGQDGDPLTEQNDRAFIELMKKLEGMYP